MSCAAPSTASGAPRPAARRGVTVLLVCLLAAAAVAAWSNSFRVPFVFDDEEAIVGNARLHRLWPGWRSAWAPRDTTLAGRPVPAFTFAVNWAIHGPDVRGYHAVNWSIHVLAALALFGLVRRTLRLPSLREPFGPAATPIALVATLLWMLHPLQTQSITYVVRRVEAMMGLFFLLTLYAVARGATSPRPRAWFAAAVSFCALGMATCETMAVAPVVALLYDRAFASGSFREALGRRRGFYAWLASTWLIVVALQWGGPRGTGAGLHQPFAVTLDYLRVQAHFVLRYIALAFSPRGLTFDYGTLAGTLASQREAGSAVEAVVVLGLVAAAVALTAWRPRWGFLPATFFLILAPSSSVIPIVTEVAADNRMYVPLAAIAVGMTTGAYLAARRWLSTSRGAMAGGALVAGVAVLLGVLTHARNADYRDALTLWQDTVSRRPTNERAHNNLGVALGKNGDREGEIAAYREAIRLAPDYPRAHLSLGVALGKKGDCEGEIAECREAIRLDPDFAEAHLNLGVALGKKGDCEGEIAEYREAIRLDPDCAQAHLNLGIALARKGDCEGEIAAYREAIRLDPDLAQAHVNLGVALGEKGDRSGEIAEYREAIRLKPDYAKAHYNLAGAYAAVGSPADCARSLRRAVELDATCRDTARRDPGFDPVRRESGIAEILGE